MVQPMRLSRHIYTLSSSLWRVYALRTLRYVTWYQSHGLGLGLDSSNSPTILFFFLFPWDPVAARRRASHLLCFVRRAFVRRPPSSSPRESRADRITITRGRPPSSPCESHLHVRTPTRPVARSSSRRRDARITWP